MGRKVFSTEEKLELFGEQYYDGSIDAVCNEQSQPDNSLVVSDPHPQSKVDASFFSPLLRLKIRVRVSGIRNKESPLSIVPSEDSFTGF